MHTKKNSTLVGAHMSIADDFYKAIIRGEAIGCTAIQLFTKSNRQWHAKSITQEEAISFKSHLKDSRIKSVVAHASYLINIGSPTQDVAQKSIAALIKEVERCHILGIQYLILHPGARLTSSRDVCLDHIIDRLQYVFEHSESNVMILLETMAGQGTTVCSSFEDIAYIIKHIKTKNRIGVAFDTCHVFAAGYDLSTKKSYEQTMQQFDTIIGLDYIKAFHLNDSKKGLDSHVDRHEELGDGEIGMKCFTLIMQDTRFIAVPKILETPDPDKYAETIVILKDLSC